MKIFKIAEFNLIKVMVIFATSLFGQMSFAETEKYLINPGDVLEISVWNEDALKREVTVLPDGSIGFPLAGTVAAAGQSLDVIKKELTEKLTEYIAEPVVNIVVKSAGGNAVYVTGQVKTPGKYVMVEPMHVVQALSLAGGLTAFAAQNDIIILRKSSTGGESIRFEYSDLEDGKGLDKKYFLKSGDVVVVP
jgi:polysaccharide biosynthesis/export protein